MSEAVTAPSGKQKSCPGCGNPSPEDVAVCPQCQTVFPVAEAEAPKTAVAEAPAAEPAAAPPPEPKPEEPARAASATTEPEAPSAPTVAEPAPAAVTEAPSAPAVAEPAPVPAPPAPEPEASSAPTLAEPAAAAAAPEAASAPTLAEPSPASTLPEPVSGPAPVVDDVPPAAAPAQTTPAAEPVAAAPTDLDAGETLMGQWKLETKLGEGGMGNVFLATELKLGRKVAVKALHATNLQEETVKRFEREAQVMGKLDHPNIVTLYAVGRHRDVPFLVMRYLEGGSLWDLLDANGGRLTPEQLLPLVKQLCGALGYIHGKNLIHRDLKPSNIFVSPQGKVTLLDLGLARGHTTALTRTGIIWGTPDFMAPEQIVGERQLDGRADLYALGVVLYRMISNAPPFPDEDEQNLMRAHLTKPRPDISKVWFQATPALSLLLQKAMAIKPEERFQTAEELSQAFERVVNTREQSTRASVPPPSAPRAASPSRPPVVVQVAAPAAVKPAPPVPLPPPVAEPEPVKPPPSAPAAVVTKPPVLTAAGATQRVIDDLDDDRTELGELPAELVAAIDAANASDTPAEGTPMLTERAMPANTPEDRTGETTAYDRPKAQPVLTTSDRTAITTLPEPKPRAAPPVLDDEPLTGPSEVVKPPPVSSSLIPGDDLDYDDDDANQKTEIGMMVGDVLTSVMVPDGVKPLSRPPTLTPPVPPPAAPPLEEPPLLEAEVAEEKTPPPPPEPPKPVRRSQARPAVKEESGRLVKEGSGRTRRSQQAPAKVEEEPESPPWMHPYVLVTGGLLLLALGFLIGVLLR